MNIPYDFSKPCKIATLAKSLKEISGIQALKDTTLLCVEDEHLNIYKFDLGKNKIVSEYGKNVEGDVEDIVIIGKTAYILCAKKRVIYIYSNYQTSMANSRIVKLQLKKKHDPEGMCFNKENGILLIACKGDPKPKSSKRKVYAFDLKKEKLLKKAFFTIDSRDLKSYQPGKFFNPSGIAIHPKTGDIYLIGSKGLKLVICLDAKGSKIRGETVLEDSVFSQPEGITFLENGDLILASEAGKQSRAKIFKLKEI